MTALISGDKPLIQASGPGIVSAGLAGAEPVYVVRGITTLDYWLMTQPEIKTAEQLKGGTVAVARFGGAADFVARYALPRLGLTPGKDVTIVQTGSTPERLAALEARRVSASTLVPPAMFVAQKKRLSPARQCRRVGLGLPTPRRRDDEKIPARASPGRAQLRQVLHRSGTTAQNRPRLGVENRRQIPATRRPRSFAENLRQLHRRKKLPAKQYPSAEGIKTILDELALKDAKARNAKPTDFIDARFVEEFDKSGYTDSLYGRKR